MKKEKFRILLVDDEDAMLQMYQAVLKKDYELVSVISGKEAVQKVIENGIHLVLLDIKMPGIDGIEVLTQIKKINPDLEVIMVTALKDVKPAVQAMKLGAYHYIEKPFDTDELKAVIKKALEKSSLKKENAYLKQALAESRKDELIGENKSIENIRNLIKQISASGSPVLITGESGTGKEIIAKTIHQASIRSAKPYLAVNCAAIPEALFESELFGHEKGSFTGAAEKYIGKFESADGGTLFLDEIGCLPLSLQSKLLRAIQEQEIQRLGSTKNINVDVHIIAATNAPLKEMIKDKTFREDLYYRLNVIPVDLPPLRQRKEDIPLFLEFFRNEFNRKLHKNVKEIKPEALRILADYDWPGNVRELQNLMERLIALSAKDYIAKEDLPYEIVNLVPKTADEPVLPLLEALKDFERNYILKILDLKKGNRTYCANALGVHRTTLISRIEALGIK